MKQDIDQICKEAFLCIQDRIKEIQTQSEKSEAKTILLPNQLCVRRSTSGIGRGPFGERAGDISDLVLTEEEQEECHRHTFTAAMSFHYSGNPILCFWKKESAIYLINSIFRLLQL